MKQSNMRLKKILIVILLLLCGITTFAQENFEINGVVTSSEDGGPIPGVSILVINTTNGTVTDFSGNYSITVKSGDKLQFSFVGFSTKTIEINNQTTLNIALDVDAAILEDVVVVGYGTRKKSHLTGAVAKIGGNEVAKLQTTRVDEALSGKLAGVQVQTISSEPGAAPKIQVRASSSVTSFGNPLLVVDGYPIQGDLSAINPNDIQSIEVLKDAASAAIYGNRAANGVILVTTKKGRQGKTSYSFNSYVSVNSVYKQDGVYPSLSEWIGYIDANSADWASPLRTSNLDEGPTGNLNLQTGNPVTYEEHFNFRMDQLRAINSAGLETDWSDNTFRSGITKNYDFNVRGGNEKSKYFASVGYLNAEGAIQDTDYERYNTRINLDTELSKKIDVGISFNGSYSDRTIFPVSLHDALRTQPFIPVFHTSESIALAQEYNDRAIAINPAFATSTYVSELQIGDYAHERHFNDRLGLSLSSNNSSQAKIDGRNRGQQVFYGNTNGYFALEIIEGLTFKSTLGVDINYTENYQDQLSFGDRRGASRSFISLNKNRTISWLSENVITYDKEINSHDINLVGGVSLQKWKYDGVSLTGNILANDQALTVGATETQTADSYSDRVTAQSGFFRANYAYDDKYLASFSIRADGNSRFGKDSKWGYFPAVSLGWNLHNEQFLEPIIETVSTLKLRVSYGSTGSLGSIGRYASLSALSTNTAYLDGTLTGFFPSSIENADLGWEKTSEIDFGTDLGFLNNKIRLSVDYFTSTTEDMLFQRSISGVTGFDNIDVNAGEVKSNGLEFELGASVLEIGDFKWNVNANLSTTKVEVTDLDGDEEILLQPDGSRRVQFMTRVGHGISEFWGYKTTGQQIDPKYLSTPYWPVNVQATDIYVQDLNGDGIIDEDDQTFLGSNIPDFIWGLTNNLNYKDIDVSFTLQGSHGAEVANVDEYYYGTSWRGSWDPNLFPAEDQAQVVHKGLTDHYIEDASFVALRNITLGYTLKENNLGINKIGVESLRIYAAASNLLYLTASGYTSYNPEGVNYQVSPLTNGMQRGATPITRSFTFGVNVNF